MAKAEKTETAPPAKQPLAAEGDASTKGTGEQVEAMSSVETGALPDRTEGAAPPTPPEAPRKRGRKPGSKSRANKDKEQAMLADASAETIVTLLDSGRAMISGGTIGRGEPVERDPVKAAWAAYCMETGQQMPAWVLVALTTTSYMAPALASEPAKKGIAGLWEKAKAWKQAKKAGVR